MELINSDINIIGGIPDFSLIEATLVQFAKGKGRVDLNELLVTNNAFDFRTESTRKRFLYAILRNILVFANDQHKQLIESLFGSPGLDSLKHRVVFWQLLVGNSLFKAISKDVYAKIYFSGRTMLASSEVYAYLAEARTAYLSDTSASTKFPHDNIRDFIEALPTLTMSDQEIADLTAKFDTLYQSNNGLEEFCIKNHINPINVWYLFKKSGVLPAQRAQTIAMEFLADLIREILNEDEDGIVPLVRNAGEEILIDRIEKKFEQKGLSSAQFSTYPTILGKEINEYLNKNCFADFSDHLNLFMYLPKTPFIWHITSGPRQGFDAYIIIYKWNRDKLYTLKSVYIE